MQSLNAFDAPTEKEGNNILHLAITVSNKVLFDYLIAILKVRDRMMELYPQYNGKFKHSRAVLEYQNKVQNTPLLFAAKRDNLEFFIAMVEQGANVMT